VATRGRERLPVVQELPAVSVANIALSCCASWPFCRWKSELELELDEDGPSPPAVEDAAPDPAAAVVVEFAAGADVDELPLPPKPDEPLSPELAAPVEPEELELDDDAGVPGDETSSDSCVPSAMGPDGFAGQEPGGLTGVLRPNGIVPAPPSAWPFAKVCWFEPWNWHWNRPLSSLFCGAVWQYGVATELG
jgi:hypothetical protein